jgi:hypothetical protein
MSAAGAIRGDGALGGAGGRAEWATQERRADRTAHRRGSAAEADPTTANEDAISWTRS